GREHAPVQGRAAPATGQGIHAAVRAFGGNEVQDFLHRVKADLDTGVGIAQAKIQTAVVVDRVTKVHPTAIDVGAVFSHVFLLVVGFPVIHVKAATDPIHGVVWVQIREAGTLHRFTAVNTKRHPAATAQEVIFTDVGPHDDPAALGKAETGGQGTGGDRKSTRLNSSHVKISYAVICLKK